jgi:hypothetical protein
MRAFPVGNGTCAPRVPPEFAALMDALLLQGANREGLQALDDPAWRRLLDFCDLAHLTLSLAQNPTDHYPAWVTERLETSLADSASRYPYVMATYQEAAAALDRAEIPHVVLKGFAQSPDYVADPRLRMQSDIDLYVPPEAAQRAQETLMQLGYRPMENMNCKVADHLPSLVRPGKWVWRGNPFDPEMPPSIEIHVHLWNSGVHVIEIPETGSFWDRRVVRTCGSVPIPTLHPADYLAYFSLHILRAVLAGEWVVHHLLELATFLHQRRRDRKFWMEWQTMHSAKLRGLEAIAFSLAEAWFSCRVAPEARAEIDAMPASWKLWLEKLGGSPLEVMFRRNKNGRVLQLLLARNWGERRAVIGKAVFPPVISGRQSPAVRIRNRRVRPAREGNSRFQYFSYLCNRAYEHTLASIIFLTHAFRFALLSRSPGGQFRTFFAASFFLIWACRFISFCSICTC